MSVWGHPRPEAVEATRYTRPLHPESDGSAITMRFRRLVPEGDIESRFIAADVRRFGHVINKDGVLGTHRA
jgi:hypothetical protein